MKSDEEADATLAITANSNSAATALAAKIWTRFKEHLSVVSSRAWRHASLRSYSGVKGAKTLLGTESEFWHPSRSPVQSQIE